MRESLAFVVLACACGVAAGRAGTEPARGPTPGRQQPTRPPSPGGEGPLRDAGSAFRGVEERWAALVPGMQLAATRESGPENVELVRAAEQDLCVRVAFEASEPVVASLLDTRGAALASSVERAGGILPEQGPVCVRKGDAVHALATGPSTARVLWVAWSSQ